jgi:uncharacterized protein (TIGR02246 family)
MNRLLTLTMVLALLSGCSQTAAPSEGTSTDEGAIRQLLADSEKNFAAHDFDKAMKFYANDSVVFFPGRPMLKGSEAIRAAMRETFGDPNVTVTIKPASIVVAASGEIAYGYGTGISTITDPVKKSVTTANSKWVTVFKKQPDGSWQATADIYNSDDPAAAPHQ